MTYNANAWLQRHRGQHPLPERGDRFLCPDCGRILSRQWFVDIFGCEPEQYQQRVAFRDPSDDPVYSREQRSAS